MPRPTRIRVAIDLSLLDATPTHLGKSRAETVTDGIRLPFVALPREGE
jgi:hypothetical protein